MIINLMYLQLFFIVITTFTTHIPPNATFVNLPSSAIWRHTGQTRTAVIARSNFEPLKEDEGMWLWLDRKHV